MTQEQAEEMKENTEKKKKTYKIVLLCVHSLVLILSVVLFICGLVVNLRHLAFHEAWHASYGIYNGSVMSILIGIIGTVISVIGKLCTYIFARYVNVNVNKVLQAWEKR